MVIRSKEKLDYKNNEPFNIVLVNPEIPPNTGNIARLCAATSSRLHLVHPLGFKISDKELKRAGLDYWHLLDIKEHEDWESFKSFKNLNKKNIWYISTRGEKNIWTTNFSPGDFLIFGSETKGLSTDILDSTDRDHIVSIPMNGESRSLNLSTSAGIVLYEALRQLKEKKVIDVVKR